MTTARPAFAPDAVAAVFGLGSVVRPPVFAARGELGRIWRLDTDRGSWAVKEPFAPFEPASVARDLRLQVAALEQGVPMPRPVLDPETGEGVAAGVRVYEWVDLRPDLGRAPAALAGDALARIHRTDLACSDDPDPWFTETEDPAVFAELADQARHQGRPWAGALAAASADLADLHEAAGVAAGLASGQPADRRLCHLDFNQENVLRGGPAGIVVIDWENAGPADPAQELASALTEFADPAALAAAYVAAGGPARLAGRESFAMAATVQANLLAHYARRSLDPAATPEVRERCAFWLAEILALRITVARIDAILAGRPEPTAQTASNRPPAGERA